MTASTTMQGSDKVLVYRYRGNKDVEEMTKDKVGEILKKEPNLHATSKFLKNNEMVVELVPADLRTEEQITAANGKVDDSQKIVSVKIPVFAWLKNLAPGKTVELVILSAREPGLRSWANGSARHAC